MDGWPNRAKKATFLFFSGVVQTEPKSSLYFVVRFSTEYEQ